MNPIHSLITKFAFVKFSPSYDKYTSYLSFIDRVNARFNENKDNNLSCSFDSTISSCSISSEIKEIKIPIRFYRYNDAKLTMLMCHGNAEDIGHCNPENLGNRYKVNICMFDYAGYGLHTLETSSEADCQSDVYSVYRYLIDTEKIDPSNIIVYGRSLGSYPACYLSHKLCTNKDYIPPRGLILISPLSSALKIVLPTTLPFSDMFKNYSLAPEITCLSLVIHGDKDEVIPYKCGREVAELLPSLTEFVTLYNRGNNDVSCDTYYDSINKFIALISIS